MRKLLCAVSVILTSLAWLPAESGAQESAATAAPDTLTETRKINLNTATGDEFSQIPNVGRRMVHEFEEYRPYVSIRQFRREIGKYVDEEQVAEYERFVFVPVDFNECDAATLQQLPGVDVSVAEGLIEARPYESEVDFLSALGDHVTEAELEAAQRYLVEH